MKQTYIEPAFPVVFEHDGCTSKCPGMTLRDYFAGQALPALVAKFSGADIDIVARLAYKIADQMLSERKSQNERAI